MTRRKLIPVEGETYGYLTYLHETDRIVRPSKSPRAGMFKCVRWLPFILMRVLATVFY